MQKTMLEFSARIPASSREPFRAKESATFRCVIVGPLAGSSADSDGPLRADIDAFPSILADIAPACARAAHTLAFRRLEDFEPLMVAEQAPDCRRWLELRRALEREGADGSAGQKAREALGQIATSEPPPPQTALSQEENPFAALLAKDDPVAVPKPAASPPPSSAKSIVDALVRQVSRPTGATPAAEDLQEQVEARLAKTLRAWFRNPEFAYLEGAWRALDELVSRFDSDDPVEIWVLASSRATWERLRVGDAVAHETLAAQLRLLPEAPDVLALADTFDLDETGQQALLPFASQAERLGAALLASAEWGGLCETVPGRVVSPPDFLDDAPLAQLRTSPMAHRIGVAVPSYRVRLPYGPGGESSAPLAFDELGGGASPAQIAPAPAGLLCLQAWTQRFVEAGADGVAWAQPTRMEGLPPYVREGKEWPATGAVLSFEAIAAASRLGLTPISAIRNAAAVQVAPPINCAGELLETASGRFG